jgi:cell wall-associated NlpC family hydrolase
LAVGAAVATVAASVLVAPAPAGAAPVSAAPSASSLQQQIKEQSGALEKIVEQYDGVAEQLKANQQKESQLAENIAPTLAKLAVARASVGQIASQAYMTGPVDSLTALVSSNDTGDLLDQMTAMDQMASSQTKDITQYATLQSQYNEQKQQLDGLIAIQNAQKKSLEDQKNTIKTKLAKLYKLRTQLYGSATEKSGGSTATAPKYLSGRGGAVVKFAYAQLGKPYAWAADGPGSYDCSGLTMAAYRSVGVTLYHKASVQWTEVHHITRSELKPGDLVFYSNLGHVAIYIGSNKIIHAPTFGENVKIASVDMMTPYGYGRP